MLCDICHQREATVHATSNVPAEDLVGHPELEARVGERDLCEVCLPLDSMSKEELIATARKLFPVPATDLRSKSMENP